MVNYHYHLHQPFVSIVCTICHYMQYHYHELWSENYLHVQSCSKKYTSQAQSQKVCAHKIRYSKYVQTNLYWQLKNAHIFLKKTFCIISLAPLETWCRLAFFRKVLCINQRRTHFSFRWTTELKLDSADMIYKQYSDNKILSMVLFVNHKKSANVDQSNALLWTFKHIGFVCWANISEAESCKQYQTQYAAQGAFSSRNIRLAIEFGLFKRSKYWISSYIVLFYSISMTKLWFWRALSKMEI